MAHILVPTDFSQGSARATTLACTLARQLSLSIRLMHVLNADDFSLASAERTLAARTEEIRELGIKCHSTFAGSRPSRHIFYETQSPDTRLLVMGTHGRIGLRRALLGSFTETALRHTSCPLVTVNPDCRLPATIRCLVLGLENSPSSEAALAEGLRLSRKLGNQRLHLVHAQQPGGAAEELDPEWVRKARATGPTTCHVERRAVPELLLRVAGEHSADLIAVGTHGRGGLARALQGSVAEEVLRRAPCPVLIIRAPSLGSPAAR